MEAVRKCEKCSRRCNQTEIGTKNRRVARLSDPKVDVLVLDDGGRGTSMGEDLGTKCNKNVTVHE